MWPLYWWCNVGTFHKRKRPVLVRDWLLQRQGSGDKKRTRCVSKPRWISFDVSWLWQKLTQGQTFNPSSLIGAIVSDGVTGGSGLGKHAVWESESPVHWQLKGCLQGQGQSSGGQYHRNVRSINISGGSLWMTSSFWTKSTFDFSASILLSVVQDWGGHSEGWSIYSNKHREAAGTWTDYETQIQK